ncbi:MAG: SurA N-terminal domain-containing protein [Candidatus Moranbacteria bacterium]|nr:SurA N-terminal domain-containing protein [Candidatus Moranbacteria bacterium]
MDQQTLQEGTPKVEEIAVVEVPGVAVIVQPSLVARMRSFGAYVSRIDRTTKIFLIVFIIFGFLFWGFSTFKGVFVAATVNGNVVSRLSVVRELEKQAGKGALDTLITKRLIAEEVQKQRIVVSSVDIDEEVKKAEAQVSVQGGTLEAVLAGQGMTMANLREQIMINKQLEKILSDKTVISDEEVNQYLSSGQVPTKGVSSEAERTQAREQLKAQKFNQEASLWVKDLKDKAAIEYFVQY